MSVSSGLLRTRALIASGDLDAQQAVTDCWRRAHALQPVFHSFSFLPDIPPNANVGPLAGISVGIKDLIDTADMPTTYGSQVYAGHQPAKDAAIVARLRELGATVLGKTVSTEFAWRHPGPTSNPWNRAHTPGGSSSGSAAAVAARIVPLAVGTQTFGSIIRPAAFCGVVGFKPTFGRLPRDGIHPLSGSLDHVGLFASLVGDIASVFALLTNVGAPTTASSLESLAGIRLARLALPADVEAAQRAAFTSACDALRGAGAIVEPMTLPSQFNDVRSIADTLLAYEAAVILAPIADEHLGEVSPSLLQLISTGRSISCRAHSEARARQLALQAEFATLIDTESIDALVSVPAQGEAPHGLASTGDARFCVPWTLLGTPAITLPLALGPTGLPMGLQLIGRERGDTNLLALATICEATLQPPPVFFCS